MGANLRLVTLLLVTMCLVLECGTRRAKERKVPAGDRRQSDQEQEECRFPVSWSGSWFIGGSRRNVKIDHQQFGQGSWCYKMHENQVFTIMKRPEKCFQCLQVWARHENVLQYKMGDCVKNKKRLGREGCSVPENAPLETLVKLDGPSAPCPFSGAYNFTYKTDGKECSSPSSEVVKCMSPAQSLLKFEVCPDDVKTESEDSVFYNTIIGLDGDSQEKLTCLGTWENDLNDKEIYMVGTLDFRYKRTDEERVRCFLVQDTSRGIQIAQSADGTCYNNLQSSQSGYRTMKLTQTETDRRQGDSEGQGSCRFPQWAVDMGPLFSFSFSSKYQFMAEVLSFSNYSSVSKLSHEMSRTNCVELVEEGEHYVKMVAKVTASCDHMYKCLRIFRRTEHILEIQEGSPTQYSVAACTPQNFDERLMIYTTLFKEDITAQPCPINGVHNVSHLDLDGQGDVCASNGFTNIDIKCKQEHVVEFYKQCPSKDPEKQKRIEVTSSASYHCLGGWSQVMKLSELPDPNNFFLNNFFGLSNFGARNVYTTDDRNNDEGGHENTTPNVTIGYVVAMRAAVKPKEEQKRICFIYMKSDLPDEWGSQYSWTVDKTACLRNIRPGFGARQKFNTTILETCGSVQNFLVLWTVLLCLASHLLLTASVILH